MAGENRTGTTGDPMVRKVKPRGNSKRKRKFKPSPWPKRPTKRTPASKETLYPVIRLDIGPDADLDGHLSWFAQRRWEPGPIGPAMSLHIPRTTNKQEALLILDRLHRIVDDLWRGLQLDPELTAVWSYDVRKKVVRTRREAITRCKREGRPVRDDPECWDDQRCLNASAALRKLQTMYSVKAKTEEIQKLAEAMGMRPRLAADAAEVHRRHMKEFMDGWKKEIQSDAGREVRHA